MKLTPEQEQAVLRSKTEVGALIGFCESLNAAQHQLSNGSDFLLLPVSWRDGLKRYIQRASEAIDAALSQSQSTLEQAQRERDEASEAFEQLAHCFPEIQVDCDNPVSAAQAINANYEKLSQANAALIMQRDELQAKCAKLEACCAARKEALLKWKAYHQADIPKNAEESEAAGEQFTAAWFEAEHAIEDDYGIAFLAERERHVRLSKYVVEEWAKEKSWNASTLLELAREALKETK